MTVCDGCGDEFSQQGEGAEPAIVSSGGWCCPTEQAYPLCDPLSDTLCSDCRSRVVFALEIGFDPGRKGENLKMSRRAFRYEWKAEQ